MKKINEMNTGILIQRQGYPYKEYRLVISPHEALSQRILKIRREFF